MTNSELRATAESMMDHVHGNFADIEAVRDYVLATVRDDDTPKLMSLQGIQIMNQLPTFTGESSITLNHETLRRILKEWLEVNISGGPWEVTAVTGDDYGETTKVTFRDAKKEPK